MRSRFTAFAIGDARYLGDTWHPRTAPASIHLDDALEWRRLEIIGTSGGGPGDDRGTVEFRAHWRMRATGEVGALHEFSRFRRVRGRWFYLDGDVEEDAAPR